MGRRGATRYDHDGPAEPHDRRDPVAAVHSFESCGRGEEGGEDRRGRREQRCVRSARVRQREHKGDLAHCDAEPSGNEEEHGVGATDPGGSLDGAENSEQDQAADAEPEDRECKRVDLGEADLDDAVVERPDGDGRQQQHVCRGRERPSRQGWWRGGARYPGCRSRAAIHLRPGRRSRQPPPARPGRSVRQ